MKHTPRIKDDIDSVSLMPVDVLAHRLGICYESAKIIQTYIAVSPELLEVAKACYFQLRELGWSEREKGLVRTLNLVITKAEGRE